MNCYIGGSQPFYFTTIDNDNMRRTINNGTLTKDFIFSKVSQVTIFSVYSGVSDYVIQHCIDTGNLISSPFRADEHPSLVFVITIKVFLKAEILLVIFGEIVLMPLRMFCLVLSNET